MEKQKQNKELNSDVKFGLKSFLTIITYPPFAAVIPLYITRTRMRICVARIY